MEEVIGSRGRDGSLKNIKMGRYRLRTEFGNKLLPKIEFLRWEEQPVVIVNLEY